MAFNLSSESFRKAKNTGNILKIKKKNQENSWENNLNFETRNFEKKWLSILEMVFYFKQK